jgi:hypothetical protein
MNSRNLTPLKNYVDLSKTSIGRAPQAAFVYFFKPDGGYEESCSLEQKDAFENEQVLIYLTNIHLADHLGVFASLDGKTYVGYDIRNFYLVPYSEIDTVIKLNHETR